MKRTNSIKNIQQTKGKIDIVVKCLALYFVMMPFDSFPMFGMGSLLKLVAFLPLIAILILHKSSKIRINRLTMIFILYVFANAITCMYSVNSAASLSELKRLILNSVVIITVGGMYNHYNVNELKYLIKALTLGGIATVVMTLLFSDTSTAGRLTLSVNGAQQDQNYINGYMYFAFAFFVNKIVDEKKVLYLFPAIVLMFFTLLTGSRGATLALAVIGGMVFLYNMFNSGRIRIGIIIVACIVALTIILGYDYILSLLPPEISVRFSVDYIANYKGTNRTDLWAEIMNIFNDGSPLRKLFGYGYGTVPTVNTFNHLVAHNLWLDHLVSSGIIGVAIMTCMHLMFVIEAWSQKNAVIFASYVGYLTMCVTLSLTNYKPLWNCMMMIMILFNIRKNEILKENSGGNT